PDSAILAPNDVMVIRSGISLLRSLPPETKSSVPSEEPLHSPSVLVALPSSRLVYAQSGCPNEATTWTSASSERTLPRTRSASLAEMTTGLAGASPHPKSETRGPEANETETFPVAKSTESFGWMRYDEGRKMSARIGCPRRGPAPQ